jgi:putative nucleotidyltransferase with HDIG domain
VIVAEAMATSLPRGGTFSISFIIIFATILLFGPAIGVWIALVGIIDISYLRQKTPHKYLIAAGELILSAAFAGWVYLFFGGQIAVETSSIGLPVAFIPIFLAATVCLIVNTSLLTFYHVFTKGIPFINIWLMNFKDIIPNFYASASVAIILAHIYLKTGVAGIFLLIIPLFTMRQTFDVYSQLHKVYLGTVRSLVKAIEAKDVYTKGHSERVAEYAVKIGRQMRLSEEKIEKLEFAGLLHDVGKIGISKKILTNPGRLTDEEFKEIKKHPFLGVTILERIKFLEEVVPAIFHHHEQYGGGGYSDGLSGYRIPLMARILAVADCFDAMTSARPYRPPLDNKTAVKELIFGSDTQFDKRAVDAFITALGFEEIAREVSLT